MTLSHLIAFALLSVVFLATSLATVWFRRARDIVFFLLVTGTAFTYRMDVNFISREWYKGTTRGFEFSILDMLAAGLLVGLLIRPAKGVRRLYWPAGIAPMLLFFGYAAFSVLISDPQLFGLFELSKLLRGLVMFLVAAYYVRSEGALRVFVMAVAAAACLEGLLALKMRYLGHVHRVPGSLGHENSLSMFMCMVAPVLLAASLSKLPAQLRYFCVAGTALAGISVILTISRMGLITCGIVLLGTAALCINYRLTLKRIMIGAFICLAVAGALGYSWKTLMSRFESSSLEEEYSQNNLTGRGSYLVLAKMIAFDRFFGVGLNNWSYWVSNEYGPKLGLFYKPYVGTSVEPDLIPVPELDGAQAAPAHNLGALTAGELGWPGFFLFAVVWIRWFSLGGRFLWPRSSDPTRRIGIGIFFSTAAVFLQSLTEWEYRQTPLMFTLHILLGAAAGLWFINRQAKVAQRKEAAAQRNSQLAA